MNCIIIDDELMARKIINKLCDELDISVSNSFSDAIQAIKYLNNQKVDLIFLDIHMPDFTGFDFIQSLKNPPKIILTTSDSNFAMEAFEYDCIIDYLVKPITLDRLKKAVQKAIKLNLNTNNPSLLNTVESATENELYVNIDRRLININIPSIYLIQAKGDYIQIKTEGENYLVHATLKKIENRLPKMLFLKVHRSYIINISKIIDIEDSSVLIKKEVIPISRSNRSELMKRLNLL